MLKFKIEIGKGLKYWLHYFKSNLTYEMFGIN